MRRSKNLLQPKRSGCQSYILQFNELCFQTWVIFWVNVHLNGYALGNADSHFVAFDLYRNIDGSIIVLMTCGAHI